MAERDRIAHYQIERLLGAGGMGEVHVAFDEKLERRVAIKMLPAARAADDHARARMLREARAASALQHPGIVTVHDTGEVDGVAYIVMELIEGETFAELLARRGRLPPDEAMSLIGEVADALGAAHEAGILHRDVKTANLMLDRRGRVRVLDFGLSKRLVIGATPDPDEPSAQPDEADDDQPIDPAAPTALGTGSGPIRAGSVVARAALDSGRRRDPQTEHGVRMGTPGYAALELLEGREADARSDVFSLAVVLYELVCATRPFPGTTWRTLQRDMSARRFVPASQASGGAVGGRFDAVISRALAPALADRFASVGALCAAAQAALAPRRRGRAAAIGAVVVGLTVTAVVVVPRWTGDRGATAAAPSADATITVRTDATVRDGGASERADLDGARALTKLGGCASTPVFSDPQTVVADLTRGAAVDLYAFDVLGGAPRQLTSAPTWEWRAVAGRRSGEVLHLVSDVVDRDGSYLAFLDVGSGAETGRIAAFSGGAAAIGDAVYYTANEGSEIRRHADGRDEQWLDLPADFATQQLVTSPGGDRMAMLAMRTGQLSRMCVIDLTAPEPQPSCLSGSMFATRPAFGPDGSALYVAASDGIQRRALDGRPDELVVPGVRAKGGVAIAPDGSALVYSDCEPVTSIVELGSEPPRLVVDDAGARDPIVGPGGRLAWIRDHAGRGAIMLRDASGAITELVSSTVGMPSFLSFDATGEHIAFVLAGSGIYMSPTRAGEGVAQVTSDQSDERPVWTLDGRLVFTRYDARHVPHVFAVDTGGGDPVRLSGADRLSFDLDRSTGEIALSAGKQVVWWNPRTGKERPGPLLPSSAFSRLTISPDGGWLLVQTGGNGQVFWRMRTGAAAGFERLFELPPDQTVGDGAIDDDGRVIAAPSVWRGELYLVPAKAGAQF